MNKPLTSTQQRVLEFIVANQRLIGPSYRDICRAFGWRSLNTCTQTVDALVKKGVVRRTPRGIEVADDGL